MKANRVVPSLWQGSAPRAGELLPFDLVVLCAKEHQLDGLRHPFGRRAEVLRVPLDDAGVPPTADEVRLAFAAGKVVRRAYQTGRRIASTCIQGRNRSGLVNALALVELGYRPDDAIELVRRARMNALVNPWFVQLIHAAGGRRLVTIPVADPFQGPRPSDSVDFGRLPG